MCADLRLSLKRAIPESVVEDPEYAKLVKVLKRAPESYKPPSVDSLGEHPCPCGYLGASAYVLCG